MSAAPVGVAAGLVGVEVVDEDEVRPGLGVAGASGALSRPDGAEGAAAAGGELAVLPFALGGLCAVVERDAHVGLELLLEGVEQAAGVVVAVGDDEHVAGLPRQGEVAYLHHRARALGQFAAPGADLVGLAVEVGGLASAVAAETASAFSIR